MALKWPNKDPDEVLDYKIDWSSRLPEGDAIATSTWIVPAGITKDSDAHDDTSTTIWLSSGTIGTKYAITNRVVTDDGRTMDQSVSITLRAK